MNPDNIHPDNVYLMESINHDIFAYENGLGIRTLFKPDDFVSLFFNNQEKLSFEDKIHGDSNVGYSVAIQEAMAKNTNLINIRNRWQRPNAGSIVLSSLLELSGVKSGTIIDLGAATLYFSASNTCPLICTGNYNAILIEKDELMSEVIEIQLLHLDNWKKGFLDKATVVKEQVGWEGIGKQFFIEYKTSPFKCLDNILEKEEFINDIVCLDLDIDGGEMFIWEQSELLKSARPPVVMAEVVSFRELGLDGDVCTGFCDFISAICKGGAIGYKPVVSWRDNLFFMADESLSKCSIDYSDDYSLLYNDETWFKGQTDKGENLKSALPRIKELLEIYKELLK